MMFSRHYASSVARQPKQGLPDADARAIAEACMGSVHMLSITQASLGSQQLAGSARMQAAHLRPVLDGVVGDVAPVLGVPHVPLCHRHSDGLRSASQSASSLCGSRAAARAALP